MSPSEAAKKRVAVFGGAFDPPHNGHLATIALLLNTGVVDRVMVVPSGHRPDKTGVSAAADRLAMTRRAIAEAFPGDAGDNRVVVSDLHVSGVAGYATIDLVEHLEGMAVEQCEYVVVIGDELIKDLSQWKDTERLRERARFLVIRRPGHTAAALPEGWNMEVLEAPHQVGVYVSSTALREMLRAGKLCAGLMPASVEEMWRSKRVAADTTTTGGA